MFFTSGTKCTKGYCAFSKDTLQKELMDASFHQEIYAGSAHHQHHVKLYSVETIYIRWSVRSFRDVGLAKPKIAARAAFKALW